MTFRSALILLLALSLLPAVAPAAESPKDWPSAIVPKVYFTPGPEYSDKVRMFQGIPSLERAPNGRLWATWYGGGVTEDRHNYIMLVTSGDDGKTWSDLKAVIDPDGDGPVRAFDPCPWVDPNGKLWLFWCQATRGGGGDPVTYAMTTENPGEENTTWSEPRFIHDGVMMCKPTALSDGTWLLPTAIWGRDESCRIVASTDRGATWTLRGAAGVPERKDRNCDEPMLVERNDGTLWLLVRTSYGIGESTSADGGRTWTPVMPWSVKHTTSRFFIRRLKSGNLLLVKHGALDQRAGRSHLTAYLSDDDGKTWKGGLLLDERGGVSYPDGAQAEDGAVYIIYDFDRTGEKFIHMAVFTEEDILAGKCVSDQARLGVVVNKADGVNPNRGGRAAAAKIEYNANADGKPMLAGEPAELEPATVSVEPVKPGATLFTNRDYRIRDIPKPLAGKRFVHGSIDGVRATCRKTGVVFVVTPSKGRNTDSLAADLTEQGFSKVNLPEFLLFDEANAPGNVCTTYQKVLETGETLKLGKWGVVVF
ncbi:MAG: sialidase family protein [Thermoguttaceae bacterium]|jgi:hypothetical protein|nr:sialidase family protein [Thermoguttaceae bacterium]